MKPALIFMLLTLAGSAFANINTQINEYLTSLHSAIYTKFYDADKFEGKTCTLKIEISREGTLRGFSRGENTKAMTKSFAGRQ
ncbi:cell envelope integrity TolA C-terminal domain-containing protein [Xenorhabdus sp. KJ12.1]|uniref:cell envelope integrity TolA C-terminal domain-containing protein n=1 Tax=Xenorhabdus sp. KJ12.1 TaxID=1851571 RepID=UPI000C0536E3|nr:cell envelope integrity TolA C-terminal domain-containing protein [Xenorhabdus sp. KJ12.1]PHM72275.1 protein TolA [Xenorhabdus sp. KJ12.1]